MKHEAEVKEQSGTETSENQKHDEAHPQTGPTVFITVDGREVRIHRGRQTVAAIKEVGGVPLAKDLCQLVNQQLVALPDDGSVVIKGGEIFVSHPKDGSSS